MAGYVYLGNRYVGYCGGGASNLFAGGLMVAPGQLYYDGGSGLSAWHIDDTWNSHNTYGNSVFSVSQTSTGIRSGYSSSYFTASDIGTVSIPSGSISYGGYSDWRIPSKEEWALIMFGSNGDFMSPVTRPKAIVNGSERWRANVVVTNNSFNGSSTTFGVLMFPDEGEFTGVPLSGGAGTCPRILKENVEEYVAQGAVFVMMTSSFSFWYQDVRAEWILPSSTVYSDAFGDYRTIFGAAYPYSSGGTPTTIGIGDGGFWSSDEGGSVSNYVHQGTGWGTETAQSSNYVIGAPIVLVRGQIDL